MEFNGAQFCFSIVQKGKEKRICFGKQETEEINADLNVKFGLIIILYMTIYCCKPVA